MAYSEVKSHSPRWMNVSMSAYATSRNVSFELVHSARSRVRAEEAPVLEVVRQIDVDRKHWISQAVSLTKPREKTVGLCSTKSTSLCIAHSRATVRPH